jgi:hypothetical protein
MEVQSTLVVEVVRQQTDSGRPRFDRPHLDCRQPLVASAYECWKTGLLFSYVDVSERMTLSLVLSAPEGTVCLAI